MNAIAFPLSIRDTIYKSAKEGNATPTGKIKLNQDRALGSLPQQYIWDQNNEYFQYCNLKHKNKTGELDCN